MPRIVFALILLVAAAPAADRELERAAREVREHAARAPFGVALDSYLRASQLLRAGDPPLAWEFAVAAAELLKTDGREVYEAGRVARSLMDLDPARGEPLARSLPGRQYPLGGLVGYWLAKEEPRRAAEILREAWRGGVYLEPGAALRALAASSLEDASGFFADLLAAFPVENATLDEVNMLANAVREMAPRDAPAAVRGLERVIDAVTAEKFNARGMSDLIATYRLGGSAITTQGARPSLLLAAGICLHALDREAYGRRRALFEPWQREIAAVPRGEMEKAARPQSVTYMRKGLLAPGAPPLEPPPAFDQKLSFAQALSKIRAEPADRRAADFMRLLLRPDVSPAEQLGAAREALQALPEASFASGRLRAATDLFAAAGEKDWKALVRPAAAALDAALVDLAACREPSCAMVRDGPDLVKAYEALAAGSRAAGIKPRATDPALAARLAILDLKSLLDRKFDFDLAATDGKRQTLRGHRGNVVLMTFWASW